MGVRGGLALGALNFPLHLWLFGRVGESDPALVFGQPGFYVGLLLGFASGWVGGLLERLRASEERYRSLVETAPLGVLVHDGERVLFANPEAGRVLGARRPEELVGRPVLSLVGAEDLPRVRQRLAALEQGRPQVGLAEETLCRLDGAPVVAEVAAARVRYGERQAVQVVLRDLSAQRQLQGTIERLTYRDPVTGLPNRAALHEAGAKILALAHRQGWGVAALWLRLGELALWQDVLGQRSADGLLRGVAERLRRVARGQDWLAYCGGGEFAFVAQNAALTGALRLARRLQAVLDTPLELEGGGAPARLSLVVGVALYPKDAAGLEELLSAAHAAAQRAQAEGCWLALFDPEGARRARERVALEGELRQALGEGGLVLHYQPVLDLRSGQVAGAEALARWPHPSRGAVSPEVFIPLAEERGLIRELDRYVLRRALGEAAALPGWVAVNLSAQSFQEPGLPRFLRESLERSGVRPGELVLEITERTLADPRSAQPVLQRLKELGVRVAVDDFGTGYSSLSYLRSFPLDHLKIDRSFVRGIGRHPEDEAVLRGILSLAGSLGLECVAEGVETAEQAEWLRREGCALAQGYHFARPMPPEHLATLARERG
ncbi:putative signaling protein [Calidithermus terrae]|uniref:Putative signaling protein n=1 Tax=Calidithermus terrae TaxID=1408545 RepID=A0A399DZM1_9DEIN|nr:putative signaling protein [Calidithermus terrae]